MIKNPYKLHFHSWSVLNTLHVSHSWACHDTCELGNTLCLQQGHFWVSHTISANHTYFFPMVVCTSQGSSHQHNDNIDPRWLIVAWYPASACFHTSKHRSVTPAKIFTVITDHSVLSDHHNLYVVNAKNWPILAPGGNIDSCTTMKQSHVITVGNEFDVLIEWNLYWQSG